MLDRSSWGRALIILGVIAVGFWVLQQVWLLALHFGNIIILFFLAWLLAFCLSPIVRSIQLSTPLGRAATTAIVYLVLLVVLVTTIVLVIPVLVQQVSGLASQLPELTTQLPGVIRTIQRAFTSRGIPIDLSAPSSQTLSQEAGQLGTQLVANTVAIASGIASGLFGFTIILIVSFY
ncbi:MAG TPA: AI-2E family transporter, partial [Chloroflexota bacterium]|nr:AI-2E family transporter [Chloroflexota bacterium]